MRRRNPFAIRPPRHMARELLRRSPAYRSVPEQYRDQVARWLLRLFVAEMLEVKPGMERSILDTMGLEHLNIKDLAGAEALQAFRFRLAELDEQSVGRESPLSRNVDRVAELVGLHESEKDLLVFVVLLHGCSVLRGCL